MISLCLSFLVCIYAPLELYLTNVSEFWMKLTDLVPPVAIMFVCMASAFSVAYIIARLINKKFYDFCLVGGTAVMLGLYICGNFLVKNLPPMNGTITKWNEYPAEIVKSALAFAVPFVILLLVMIIFKSKIIRKVTFTGSLCFLLLFAITLSTLFITSDTDKPETLTSTEMNLLQMSEDRNLVVLVLDTLDGETFKKAIEDDGEIKELLDGFTCYDDTLAAYPFTERALPMLFSGKWYENDVNFQEYRTKAISNSVFIKELEKNDYTIGLYEHFEIGILDSEFKGRFENFSQSSVNYKTKYIYQLILKMGGVKYAPWLLKSVCANLDDFSNYCRTVNSEYKKFPWSDSIFYERVNNEKIDTSSDKKCARIIHLEGGHIPYVYDEEFNKIEDGNYQKKVDGCVNLVKQYIKRLKESGVYDNTAIVVIGDHGCSGGNEEDEYSIRKRMHAGFMVKGIDEHHDFKYSSAPIQYDEIAGGITKLINGVKGDDIFDIEENAQRTRRMMIYLYNDENHLKEYTTDDKASNPDAMKPTGKEYNIG